VNHHYRDIREKINEAPQWFDESAVPRYCRFSPKELADIYADECALLLIQCQCCRQKFHVAISTNLMRRMTLTEGKYFPTIADDIRNGRVGFGDPPNVDCCPAGPTMSSDTLAVLEYWSRQTPQRDWTRDATMEKVIEE
jgi:hypothetical protein